MFVVYVLRSQVNNRHYIGHTRDIQARLKKHNDGRVRSTKSGVPWQVVYTENFQTKNDAYRRELEIKSYKGGEAFKKLLK